MFSGHWPIVTFSFHWILAKPCFDLLLQSRGPSHKTQVAIMGTPFNNLNAV